MELTLLSSVVPRIEQKCVELQRFKSYLLYSGMNGLTLSMYVIGLLMQKRFLGFCPIVWWARTRNLVLQIHLDQKPLCKLRTIISKLVYFLKICAFNNINILYSLRAPSGPPAFTPFSLGIGDMLSEGRHDPVRNWVPPKKMLTISATSAPLSPLAHVKFWAIDSYQHAKGAPGNDNITVYIYKSSPNT